MAARPLSTLVGVVSAVCGGSSELCRCTMNRTSQTNAKTKNTIEKTVKNTRRRDVASKKIGLVEDSPSVSFELFKLGYLRRAFFAFFVVDEFGTLEALTKWQFGRTSARWFNLGCWPRRAKLRC